MITPRVAPLLFVSLYISLTSLQILVVEKGGMTVREDKLEIILIYWFVLVWLVLYAVKTSIQVKTFLLSCIHLFRDCTFLFLPRPYKLFTDST